MYTYHYDSPIGGITLASNGEELTGLWFDGQKYFGSTLDSKNEDSDVLCGIFHETAHWLDIYFAGNEPDFIPPIKLIGSEFRKEVWEILQEIPYGKTITYGDIASKIATKRNIERMSAQAVGGAIGHNPIGIIVPCHRVIGTDGNLTGYAGGIERKEALLKLERNLYYT